MARRPSATPGDGSPSERYSIEALTALVGALTVASVRASPSASGTCAPQPSARARATASRQERRTSPARAGSCTGAKSRRRRARARSTSSSTRRLDAGADVVAPAASRVGRRAGSPRRRRRRRRSRASGSPSPKIVGVPPVGEAAAEDRDHAALAERVLARAVDVGEAQRDRREAVQRACTARGSSRRRACACAVGRERLRPARPPASAPARPRRRSRRRWRRDEAPRAGRCAAVEHVDRAVDVDARVEGRVGDRAAHVDLRGEVEDDARARRRRTASRSASASRDVGARAARRRCASAPSRFSRRPVERSSTTTTRRRARAARRRGSSR